MGWLVPDWRSLVTKYKTEPSSFVASEVNCAGEVNCAEDAVVSATKAANRKKLFTKSAAKAPLF